MPWEAHWQWWQRMMAPEPIPEPEPETPETIAAAAALQQQARRVYRQWSMLNTRINALTQSRRGQR